MPFSFEYKNSSHLKSNLQFRNTPLPERDLFINFYKFSGKRLSYMLYIVSYKEYYFKSFFGLDYSSVKFGFLLFI